MSILFSSSLLTKGAYWVSFVVQKYGKKVYFLLYTNKNQAGGCVLPAFLCAYILHVELMERESVSILKNEKTYVGILLIFIFMSQFNVFDGYSRPMATHDLD